MAHFKLSTQGPHKPALLAFAAFTAAYRPELPRVRPFEDYEAEFAPFLLRVMSAIGRDVSQHAEIVSLPFWKLQYDTAAIWEVDTNGHDVDLHPAERRRAYPASLRRLASGGLRDELWAVAHRSPPDARRFVQQILDDNSRAVPGVTAGALERLYLAVLHAPTEGVGRPKVRQHTLLQERIVRLGLSLGQSSYVPPGDRAHPCEGGTLGTLPGVTSTLPDQCASLTVRYAREIDVIWSSPDTGSITGVFEVEDSTAIYSGFLRMTDLLTAIPNFAVPGVVLVPDEKWERALVQLDRPTFRRALRGTAGRLGAIAYSALPDDAALGQHFDELDEVMSVTWQAG